MAVKPEKIVETIGKIRQRVIDNQIKLCTIASSIENEKLYKKLDKMCGEYTKMIDKLEDIRLQLDESL